IKVVNNGPFPSENVVLTDDVPASIINPEYSLDGGVTFQPWNGGFFEFAMMRTRHDIDQKLLAELYYQYMNVEEDFIKDLFYSTE
ncbi:hypothetical protein ACTPEM_25290, partial [Clostridioides difficile]